MMMKLVLKRLMLAVVVTGFMQGCGGGGSDTPAPDPVPSNDPPGNSDDQNDTDPLNPEPGDPPLQEPEPQEPEPQEPDAQDPQPTESGSNGAAMVTVFALLLGD